MARGLGSRPGPAGFEEELSAVSQQDQRAVDEVRELERIYALHESQNRARQESRAAQAAKGLAKDEAKRVAKAVGKRAMVWAGESALGSFVVAIGGALSTILLVLAGIFLVVVMVAGALYYSCRNTGVMGYVTGAISTAANWLGATDFDICQVFDAAVSLQDQAPPQTLPNPPAGTDLVQISGVPVNTASTSDPRLRPCMLAHIRNVYTAARAAGIDFEITSAYRPGAVTAGGTPSAHGRGEAVDFVIIPRPNPPGSWRTDRNFQRQIDRLVGIAMAEGFRPVQGDTLDEYRRPAENATGDGHIHIEFNAGPNGTSYCTSPI